MSIGRVWHHPMEGGLLARFIDREGRLDAGDVATWFGVSSGQLAETLGLAPETLRRRARAAAPRSQARLREMLEIVGRVSEMAGGPIQALAWYRAQPLPAFGGRTAEALVKDGKAAAVREHLDAITLGGFA